MTPLRALLVATLGLLVGADGNSQTRESRQAVEALAKQVSTPSLDPATRDGALAQLDRLDETEALAAAKTALADPSPLLRARAGWIVAASGDDAGAQALRRLAAESVPESVLAIESLGRLGDRTGHDILREQLSSLLATPSADRGRSSTLIKAIGDYCDTSDGALLKRALTVLGDGASWDEIEAVGKTGSADAIPVLEPWFARRAPGWKTMSVGLALARSGSETGSKYLRERLSDFSGDPANRIQCCPTDGLKDDPFGPKATDFLLTRLGVPADRRFLDDLTAIAQSPRASERIKGFVWVAIAKLDVAMDPAILKLAREHLDYEGAARLLVLTDESESRRLFASYSGATGKETSAFQLLRALSANGRDRRLWRDTRGYVF